MGVVMPAVAACIVLLVLVRCQGGLTGAPATTWNPPPSSSGIRALARAAAALESAAALAASGRQHRPATAPLPLPPAHVAGVPGHQAGSSPTVPRMCSPAEAARQGKEAGAAKVRGCPAADDPWIRLVHLLMPNARTFVDIGSNKGYSGARFYALWNPELGLDEKVLHSHLAREVAKGATPELKECGACGDCRGGAGPLLPRAGRVCGRQSAKTGNANYQRELSKGVGSVCARARAGYAPIQVHSFDGNAGLVSGLRSAIGAIASGGTLHGSTANDLDPAFRPDVASVGGAWTVTLAAFSEDGDAGGPGGRTVQFVQGLGEVGHLSVRGVRSEDAQKRGGGTLRAVPMLSVDAWRERMQIKRIDVLKIDVEGHDVSVLRSARRTLSSGLASVVMFEYHHKWPTEHTLGSVVEWMAHPNPTAAGYGGPAVYVCYLEGKNLLLRLTGCWDKKLELRRWSNVWCLHSVHAATVVTAFDAYSIAFMQ